MSLDNCGITSTPASGSGATIIEMLEAPPSLVARLPERLAPNQMYGWLNGASNMVELFVTSADGYYFNRMSSGTPLSNG